MRMFRGAKVGGQSGVTKRLRNRPVAQGICPPARIPNITWRRRAAVTCQERERGRYGRVVAVCRVQGEDLGTRLVGNGRALAYRRQLVHQPEVHVSEAARMRVRGMMP